MYPRKRRREFTLNDLKTHLARNIANLRLERDKLDQLLVEATQLRDMVQTALKHLEKASDILGTV